MEETIRAAELIAGLVADGYGPGRATAAAHAIDCEAAAGGTCDACGHVGLRMIPLLRPHPTNPGRRQYQPVLECPDCGAGQLL